jgi:hypothetical protein
MELTLSIIYQVVGIGMILVILEGWIIKKKSLIRYILKNIFSISLVIIAVLTQEWFFAVIWVVLGMGYFTDLIDFIKSTPAKKNTSE